MPWSSLMMSMPLAAREFLHRQTLGLQRGAGERTAGRTGEPSQALDAEARPAAGAYKRIRQIRIDEFHMIEQ